MDIANLKPVLLASILLILYFWESISPYFPGRSGHLAHSARNIGLGIVNAFASILILGSVLYFVFTVTHSNQLGILNIVHFPDWLEFLLAIILFDLWQYFWHRLNHRFALLWRFHRVHHADKSMDASTSVRFHTVEILLSGVIRLIVIPLIGMDWVHLLAYELLALPIILFHHSNIRINESVDRLLRVLIVTPHMHRLHHSELRSETDSNYASIFSFWDRLFNSYTMRNIETNFTLGLGQQFSEKEWNRLPGMLKIPFLKGREQN